MTHKDHLQQLLQTDKIQVFLDELLKATKDNGQQDLHSNLTLQSGRFHSNERQKRDGLITDDTYNRTNNQIRHALKSLLEEYEEDSTYEWKEKETFTPITQNAIKHLNPTTLRFLDEENLAFQDLKGKNFKVKIEDSPNIEKLLKEQRDAFYDLQDKEPDLFNKLRRKNRHLFEHKKSAKPPMKDRDKTEIIVTAEPPMMEDEPETMAPPPPSTGIILHSIPPKMQLNNLHRCIIRIAFDKEMVLADLPTIVNNTVIKENIRVTDTMEVTFEDSKDFEINPISDPIQIVDQYSATQWDFDVRPLSLGKYPLSFKVAIILPNGKKQLVLTESVIVVNESVETALELKEANLMPENTSALVTVPTDNSTVPTDNSPKKIFFSYSKDDKAYLTELLKFLSPLKRSGKIIPWDDSKLAPGEEWDDAIKAALAEANIILLLVSANFLATDYIWEVELKTAMMRHEKNEARVIPIFINHCDWSDTPFGKLTGLPTNAKPVAAYTNPAEAWSLIINEIKKVLV